MPLTSAILYRRYFEFSATPFLKTTTEPTACFPEIFDISNPSITSGKYFSPRVSFSSSRLRRLSSPLSNSVLNAKLAFSSAMRTRSFFFPLEGISIRTRPFFFFDNQSDMSKTSSIECGKRISFGRRIWSM